MNHKMLTDRDLANDLIPKRLIPPVPEKFKGKEVRYVFDDEDEVTLTFKEVVEMITTARGVGPRMVPVMGTVNGHEVNSFPDGLPNIE